MLVVSATTAEDYLKSGHKVVAYVGHYTVERCVAKFDRQLGVLVDDKDRLVDLSQVHEYSVIVD